MKKDEKEIKRIYVVREEDLEHHKYVSQILIEYEDKKVKYFSLSPSKLKGSSKKQEKAKQKMGEQLKKILKGLEKEDYKKILFVKDSDQLLRRYVDRKIQIEEAHYQKHQESIEQIISSVEIGTSLVMMLSPLHGPLNIFFNSVASSSASTAAILRNQKRRNLPKVEPEWARKLRFSLSVALLGINIGLGAKNLAVSIDQIVQPKYSTETEGSSNLADQQYKLTNGSISTLHPISDEVDNPFRDGVMFSSADAATNLLMEAFELNPNLQEGDRLIAQSIRQYVNENPYFNYEKCYDDFSTFELITTNEIHGAVAAINSDSDIIVYQVDNMEYKKFVKHVQHELIHSTGNLYNRFLNEGMTTLICSEYMNDFSLSSEYFDQVLGTKIFCELITPEKMLEAYSKEDMGIIEAELAKINPEKYQELLNIMQSYHSKMIKAAYDNKLSDFYIKESPQFKVDFSNLISDFVSNSNLSDEQEMRISYYLSAIGQRYNIQGVIYFNKSVEKEDYVKAYNTESVATSLESGYSY